jgi:hypothetical protein
MRQTVSRDRVHESTLISFHACYQDRKLFQALIRATQTILAYGDGIPTDIAAAINEVVCTFLSNPTGIGDNFSMLYFAGKALRTHFPPPPLSRPFRIPNVRSIFSVFQTIQLKGIHGSHVVINYWKLMLEVIVRCVPLIAAGDQKATTFVKYFHGLAVSICQNQELSLEHTPRLKFQIARKHRSAKDELALVGHDRREAGDL